MYQSHVYLEVRVLVSADRKAFCSCAAGTVDTPSAPCCPVCGQESGAVPIPDPSAVRKAYMLSGALGCSIPRESAYERLAGTIAVPSGTCLSGLSLCLAEKGKTQIEFHRRKKTINIEEIRIEEDAGRLTHSDGNTRMDYTYVGCSSLRIRTAADFELGEEAEIFLDNLRQLIQYLKIVTGVPVESVMRCNAYVALAQYPDVPSYYVKLRNLNSFNFVRKAVNAELSRQESILTSGGTVPSESRLWNERQNRTELFRNRSQADLRHFVPLEPVITYIPDTKVLEESADISVELPEDRKARLAREYGFAVSRCDFICDEKSRADFFEESVRFGANPMDAAHWITGDVTGLLRRAGMEIGSSPLTPERFAYIMKLFTEHHIHSRIVKQLLQTVLETGAEPEDIMRRNQWEPITDRAVLLPLITHAIESNPEESEKLRDGDMAPLEFLTGIIMKKTGGMAHPAVVKELLKETLNISLVYVLSMGGAICGRKMRDGSVSASGDGESLMKLLSAEGLPPEVRVQIVRVGGLLSEEMEPGDWAALIAAISSRVSAGTATGIVIAHGTDTLAYTAGLLYWLFADAEVPIVITASSSLPEVSDEARENLNLAVRVACREKQGVYVAYGGRILSPLNLKFEKPAFDGFSNWNMKQPVFTGSGLLAGFPDTDCDVMKEVLREAADRLFVCRVYPGMRAEHLLPLIDEGVSYFFLELYETGTGSMRDGPYSLKPLLIRGRKRGCRFYCTSQQQSLVDFSGYTTSRRVWREGAVPMGGLTTESAVALYFAASLVCDTAEELDQLMESYSETFA